MKTTTITLFGLAALNLACGNPVLAGCLGALALAAAAAQLVRDCRAGVEE